ncbi:hypothetical protein C9374_005293 [Naegleria lovaniensis]|uniref:ABC transporter domain-containing protein n=1 Tax=Naegleria lovaniensis TaxID=51637 RepID=A0AA88KK94_NAELO|nr:uncharacterized protein C9374_005293 [Naegleria lovaniensis]KAG2382713.1 hypothetical protein C9374_005293 [Naegleria lovaniensis]
MRSYFRKYPRQVLALLYREWFNIRNEWITWLFRILAPSLIILLVFIIQQSILSLTATGGDSLFQHDFTLDHVPQHLKKPNRQLGEKYLIISSDYCPFYQQAWKLFNISKTIGEMNDPPLSYMTAENSTCLNFGEWSKCETDICVIGSNRNKMDPKMFKKLIESNTILGAWVLGSTQDWETGSFMWNVDVIPSYLTSIRNPFFSIGVGVTTVSEEQNKLTLMNVMYRALNLNNSTRNSKPYTLDMSIHHVPSKRGQDNQKTDNMLPMIMSQRLATIMIPGLIIISLFLSASHINGFIARDRQLRVGMKCYGLMNSSYWTFVFVFEMIHLTLVCAIMTAVGYICQLNFFTGCSDPLIIFIILWGMAFYFCCLLATASTFIRANSVSNITLFFLLVSNVLFTLVTIQPEAIMSPTVRINVPSTIAMVGGPMYMFPTAAYSIALTTISFMTNYYIDSKTGVIMTPPGFKDIDYWVSPVQTYYDNTNGNSYYDMLVLPPYLCMIDIIGQGLVFILLTIYLDNVIPPAFDGIRQSIFYLCSPKYWGFRSKKIGRDDLAIDFDTKGTAFEILEDIDPDVAREYKETTRSFQNDDVSISVIQLGKTFTSLFKRNTNNKNALNGVTFHAKRNEITAILGHSAAGKSTLCKILTGLMAPSSGDAIIEKMSIAKDFQHIQEHIGVCMQDDFIIDNLTARQHLIFFSMLRAVPFRKLREEARTKLERVFLTDSADKMTRTFSGGMKRRLSLATSMIGDPSVLFLDEITTGVDIVMKRKIWNMLAEYKKMGKTIILTTHSMEEAENIGDKIVVLALGKIRACGHISHLKKRWGAGYKVDLIMMNHQGNSSHHHHHHGEKIKNIISNKYAPNKLILIKENINTNSLTYRLNLKPKQIYDFLQFLNETTWSESSSDPILKDYALSFTSMKDVFTRVTHGGSYELEASLIQEKESTTLDEDDNDEDDYDEPVETPQVNKRFFSLLSQLQSDKVKLIMDKNYSLQDLRSENVEIEITVKARHNDKSIQIM